jgi:hypothetical protein
MTAWDSVLAAHLRPSFAKAFQKSSPPAQPSSDKTSGGHWSQHDQARSVARMSRRPTRAGKKQPKIKKEAERRQA